MILDGSATGIASGTNKNSATLTTTTAGDIIMVVAYCELSTGSPTVSSVVASGLLFTKRSQSNGSGKGDMEVWYAVAPYTLAGTVITVNYSSNFDDASVIAFGVSGATSSPPYFDPNVSLPLVQSFTANPSTPSFTLTTTNGTNFLFVSYGSAAPSTAGAPTGWTLLASANNGGGSLFSYLSTYYKIVSSVQTGVTVTASSSYNPGSAGEAILDALSFVGTPGSYTAGNVSPPLSNAGSGARHQTAQPAVPNFTPSHYNPIPVGEVLQNGTTGVAYSESITAQGGTSPYTFAVTSGTLPTSLSLSSGGAITGTPSATGTFTFTVTVTDSLGFTGSQVFQIIIAAPSGGGGASYTFLA